MRMRRQRRGPGAAFAFDRLEPRACPAMVSIAGMGGDANGIEIAEAGPGGAVTVTLSAASTRTVSVAYLVTGVGASPAAPKTDVQLVAGGRSLASPMGTLVFRPGQTTQRIQLVAVNDQMREGNEGLRIQLFKPMNCSIQPTASMVPITVRDDDAYTAALVLEGAASVAEGQPARAAIQLSSPASRTEVFYVSTTDGTATATDYRPFRDLPVTILAGQSRSQSFVINTVSDSASETDEFLMLTARHTDPSFPQVDLVGVTVLGTGPAPPPTLSVANVTLDEGNSGLKPAVFTIRLSRPSLDPVTVQYATANGSASAGEDYVAASGSVTFLPGQITKTVAVSVIGDTRAEEDETFQFILSNPTVAALGDAAGVAVATIRDDEPKFEITLNFITTAEGPVPEQVRTIAAEAAARWSRIIVGDLPDVGSGTTKVDDLEMTIQMGLLGSTANGPSGVLANARPTAYRDGGQGLPYSGVTGLNPYYTTWTTDSERWQLLDTITHEMGHALGYTPDARVYARWINTGGSLFVGPNATREYRSLFAIPSGTPTAGVPLDATTAHWSEAVFDAELMSPIAEAGREYISRVTIGALQDMGYAVDYAAAEPYVRPARTAAAATSRTATSRDAGWMRTIDFSRLASLLHEMTPGTPSRTRGPFVRPQQVVRI